MTPTLMGTIYISFIGYFVVFMVLCMLFVVISLLRKFDDAWLARETSRSAKLADAKQNIDNTTLILISAAIGTYFKGGAVVKRIRVLPSANIRNSSWSVQGRESIQGSHFKR